MPASAPTLVTAVCNLGLEKLPPPSGVDAAVLRARIDAVLALDLPMAIYVDAENEAFVHARRGSKPTLIRRIDPAAFAAHELFSPLQALYQDPQWRAQDPSLPSALHTRLPLFNPVLFSTPLWLYEQAQNNPFGSSHLYWTDAGLGLMDLPNGCDADALSSLSQRHQHVLMPCRPSVGHATLDGFPTAALAALAGVDNLHWRVLGGFFGGLSAAIVELVTRYSRRLEETLGTGLLGTRDSLLTLHSLADAELVDLQFLGADETIGGLLTPGRELASAAARDILDALTETWILSFNAPQQLQSLLESLAEHEPAMLHSARRVLLNTSTNEALMPDYHALCERFGLEHIREGNHGIHGARMRTAELFQRSGRYAMFWFEDDMLLDGGNSSVCASGLPRHVPLLARSAVEIQQAESADYVKLSFSEDHLSHHKQTAWNDLDANVRAHYFPDQKDAPALAIASLRRCAQVSYAVGEASYSRWPHLLTRRANHLIFFTERKEPCSASYWTARSFEMLRQSQLCAVVLLASPIVQRRVQHYSAAERVEFQRVDALPHNAPPVDAAGQNPVPAMRDWPLQPGAIFVAVANYRDSETPHTLRDLFAKAARPERVFVGVFSQVVPGTDDDCLPGFLAHGAPPGHVRELRVHAAESMGACWARSRVFEELMQGEEFFLQIDSHSRFEPAWDDQLLKMLADCPTPRALLTAYPPSYTLPDTLSTPMPSCIAANYFDNMGILVARAKVFSLLRPPRKPVPNAFLSAGCLFGPSRAIREVPYDPHLYFHGEEPSLALRFWTHGWDLYAPQRPVLYHDYSSDRGRPRNWDDRHDWVSLNIRSVARLRHLFGIEESTSPAVLQDLDRYGLGKVRTVGEYAEYADIDLAASRIGPRAADGCFPPHPSASTLAMQRAARERYQDFRAEEATLPVRETRSGDAAAYHATMALRSELNAWLRANGIRSLVDAGCGDFNWMQYIDASGLAFYAGFDIVPEIIMRNQQLFGARRGHFFALGDIARTPLPACDALLCRRVLCDMPREDALLALENFRSSGARFLLASTRAHDVQTGQYAFDLQAAPFGLPRPESFLQDGNGAILAVWRLDRQDGYAS